MSHLIRLIIRHDYTWLKSKAEGSVLQSFFFFFSPHHTGNTQTTALVCVNLMNARGIFTECKCEEVEIHLDFGSPSESIRGGSASIC